MLPFFSILTLLTLTNVVPQAAAGDCVGTISSLSDVDAAVQCKTVNINSFTVPAGQTFNLNLLQGTTVNVQGDIGFGGANWAGPLFQLKGEDITFNGNKHTWHGHGTFYWDGQGGSGGVAKPSPMMAVMMSGTLSDVHVLNSPERCFAISSSGPLVINGAIVDNRQGAHPNSKSNGLPAGRNTDAFDLSGDDIVIRHSSAFNQDDCVAINSGKNILFEDNYCADGHGISIGSISSDTVVQDVTIRGNTVVNSVNGFRIKTDQSATNSRVSNITFVDNIAKNCTEYGLLITQSYPETVGTPGNGVIISDVNFSGGATEIEVEENAYSIVVNCGHGSCTDTWDWSGLSTSGGKVGKINDKPSLIGYVL